MGKAVIHLDLTEPGRGIAMIDQDDRPQALIAREGRRWEAYDDRVRVERSTPQAAVRAWAAAIGYPGAVVETDREY